MKKRSQIPQAVADMILFAADHTCCKCRESREVDIHHIDGDPSNNAWENLIPLCLNCHSEVGKTGGRGRKYGKYELYLTREDWFEVVAKQRQKRSMSTRKSASSSTTNVLSAQACMEVRKILYSVELAGLEWKRIESLLPVLIYYSRDFGFQVKHEVLLTLLTVSHWTREGMPATVAQLVEAITLNSIPIYNLKHAMKTGVAKKDLKLISLGLEIASNIVYDTCKSLRDIRVLNAACYLLLVILRFARVNRLPELEKNVFEEIRISEKLCERLSLGKAFPSGKAELQEIIKEALSFE
jgi:hypothetical protein